MKRRTIQAARRVTLLSAICACAGCAPRMAMTQDSPQGPVEAARVSLELPRLVPIPDIPVALRGCWDSIPPTGPEEPGGPHRLIITDKTVEEAGDGVQRRVATAEYVTKVSPISIEGLFSFPDRFGRATLATALMLDDDQGDSSVDQLTRREGDAGSSDYSRCQAGR